MVTTSNEEGGGSARELAEVATASNREVREATERKAELSSSPGEEATQRPAEPTAQRLGRDRVCEGRRAEDQTGRTVWPW